MPRRTPAAPKTTTTASTEAKEPQAPPPRAVPDAPPPPERAALPPVPPGFRRLPSVPWIWTGAELRGVLVGAETVEGFDGRAVDALIVAQTAPAECLTIFGDATTLEPGGKASARVITPQAALLLPLAHDVMIAKANGQASHVGVLFRRVVDAGRERIVIDLAEPTA